MRPSLGTLSPRPSGRDINEYKSPETWPLQRWAWEFLRRNPEFKEVSKRFEANSLKPEEMVIELKKFGLRKWKNYRLGYRVGAVPQFTDSIRIGIFPNITPDENSRVIANVRVGEIAIVFRPFEQLAGFNSIKWQLKLAHKFLVEDCSKLDFDPGKVGPYEVQKDLLPLIRILDLQASNSQSDAAEILFPEKVKALKTENGGLLLDRDTLREVVAQPTKDAIKMCQSGYQELALRYSIEHLKQKKKPAAEDKSCWPSDPASTAPGQ